MSRQIGSWIATTAIVQMMLAAVTAELPNSSFEVTQEAASGPVLPGDDKLTCPQILAEAQSRNREFEALLGEADRLKVPMSERTMALLAAHEAIATAAAIGPPGSEMIGGAATSAATNAYMESARADERKAAKPIEQRLEFAMARSDYLNGLHQKKCIAKAARKGPRPATCPKMKAGIDQLRKEMEAGNAEIMGLAKSYNPSQAMSGARAASTASSLLGALVPGLGGLISSGASAATRAAQRAQFEGLQAKASAAAQRQAALGERIAALETDFEEKCA